MILILDFYVDEPACFGVPPYLSPYCRYAAGALLAAGRKESEIDYMTVDQWRANGKQLRDDYELVLLISGTTVPGRYLGGKIGSVAEVLEFLEIRQKTDPSSVTIIGGPIRYVNREIQDKIAEKGGYIVRGDLELYAEKMAAYPGGISAAEKSILQQARFSVLAEKRTYEDVDRYATRGAMLTNLHPNFPHLILELETYRGCTRDVFCSFCTEAFYGKPVFRPLKGILDEVKELALTGNHYYRLGRQADLMTYLPDMNDFENSFPRPVPASIENLYSGIRRADPDLKLLHLDNINPGLIATFPKESEEIIRIICDYNTPGDTAAMGLESADPAVIAANDLKCSPEEAKRAVAIVNKYGQERVNGLPKLLPGVNLLHGLTGETEKTFEMNYAFLKDLLDHDLLLRRINIRQAVKYRNTKYERNIRGQIRTKSASGKQKRIEQRFLYYRDKIRKDIDREMFKRNFPPGTILSDVILEQKNPNYYLGRPLGSYPVTIKIPLDDKNASGAWSEKRPLRCTITGAEERSLKAVSYPVKYDSLGVFSLESIPGLSKNQARIIFLELGKSKSLANANLDSISHLHPVFRDGLTELTGGITSDPGVPAE